MPLGEPKSQKRSRAALNITNVSKIEDMPLGSLIFSYSTPLHTNLLCLRHQAITPDHHFMTIEFDKTQSQQAVSSIFSSIPRGFKASILFKNGKSAYEDIFRD
nr:hypothetical protein CFP56_41969 [Quercus suber]